MRTLKLCRFHGGKGNYKNSTPFQDNDSTAFINQTESLQIWFHAQKLCITYKV